MAFNSNKHVISKIIDSKFPLEIEYKFLASFLKISLLPLLLLTGIFLFQWQTMSLGFVVSHIFAALFGILGPYLIYVHDTGSLPEFFEKSQRLFGDSNLAREISRTYNSFFEHKYLYFAIPWTIGFCTPPLFSIDYLTEQGLGGYRSYTFWLYYLDVLYVGFIFGIIFSIVCITFLIISDLLQQSIEIEPLHVDKLGGMSVFGYLAIRTTLIFSSGSLLLPVSFQYTYFINIPSLPFLGVSLYILVILVSFFYPTFKVNRRADEVRNDYLNQIKEQIQRKRHELDNNEYDTLEMIKESQRLQDLITEYKQYEEVQLYPMQVEIFLKLLSSLIGPLFFLGLEIYLGKLVG